MEQLAAVAAEALRERDEAAAARDVARNAWQTTRRAAEEAEARSSGRRRERSAAEARIAQLETTLPDHEAALRAMDVTLQELAAATTAADAADARAAADQQAADAAREARRRQLLELERDTGGSAGTLGDLERAAQTSAIAASRAEDALAALGRERELALEGLPDEGDPALLDGRQATRPKGRCGRRAGHARRRGTRGGAAARPTARSGRSDRSTRSPSRSTRAAGRLDELTDQETDLTPPSTRQRADRALEGEIASDSRRLPRSRRASTNSPAALRRWLRLARAFDGEDGEAPGGIEIVVRPPGKRLQRLAMLSGGERALAGVALLFAMLSVNPVPFCILDEVDAALDEANIGRFADALRKLSRSIDFVVITHNRATIEVADTIYGVTMTDAAVSRVLSLRLADIPVEVTA